MKYQGFDLFFYRHNKHQRQVHPLSPRPLPFNELTLCLDGELNYSVDGNPTPLSAGDAIFIRKGQIRSRTDLHNYADYVSFNFRCDTPLTLKTKLEKVIDREIRLALMYCDECKATGLNENLDLVAQTVLNKLAYEQQRPTYCKLTQKILQLLASNLYGRISLEQVSKQTFFSEAYCQSVFKKDMRKTIMSYFNTLKIEEAKALMIQGELKLPQIAEMLGFDDYNYFSRLFKKQCGYSPKEYITNLKSLS